MSDSIAEFQPNNGWQLRPEIQTAHVALSKKFAKRFSVFTDKRLSMTGRHRLGIRCEGDIYMENQKSTLPAKM